MTVVLSVNEIRYSVFSIDLKANIEPKPYTYVIYITQLANHKSELLPTDHWVFTIEFHEKQIPIARNQVFLEKQANNYVFANVFEAIRLTLIPTNVNRIRLTIKIAGKTISSDNTYYNLSQKTKYYWPKSMSAIADRCASNHLAPHESTARQ